MRLQFPLIPAIAETPLYFQQGQYARESHSPAGPTIKIVAIPQRSPRSVAIKASDRREINSKAMPTRAAITIPPALVKRDGPRHSSHHNLRSKHEKKPYKQKNKQGKKKTSLSPVIRCRRSPSLIIPSEEADDTSHELSRPRGKSSGKETAPNVSILAGFKVNPKRMMRSSTLSSTGNSASGWRTKHYD